jgi:hypothetical protein
VVFVTAGRLWRAEIEGLQMLECRQKFWDGRGCWDFFCRPGGEGLAWSVVWRPRCPLWGRCGTAPKLRVPNPSLPFTVNNPSNAAFAHYSPISTFHSARIRYLTYFSKNASSSKSEAIRGRSTDIPSSQPSSLSESPWRRPGPRRHCPIAFDRSAAVPRCPSPPIGAQWPLHWPVSDQVSCRGLG